MIYPITTIGKFHFDNFPINNDTPIGGWIIVTNIDTGEEITRRTYKRDLETSDINMFSVLEKIIDELITPEEERLLDIQPLNNKNIYDNKDE